VNWADLNPVKRRLKVEPGAVYVAVTLDKPLGGITLAEPKGKPWIKVQGLTLEAAAELLPGRTVNWHTVPMSIRASLEIDFKGLEMPWSKLKEWVG
jgi:hypothetical protein